MELRKSIAREFSGKLRDQSGVTLVLAMVVFLIAALLSMTLITGALTSVQNAARQRKEEQAYLSSVSAASLLQHYICDNGAFVRHVQIEKDNDVYESLSPDLQAKIDEGIGSIFTSYNLTDNLTEGWLAFPDGTTPKLCEKLSPSPLVEELITYSLCYLLSPKGQSEQSHEIVITTPVIGQKTTVDLTMGKGDERWKLTANLSTETEKLMPYLSVLTFSCSVEQKTDSFAVEYNENVTAPDGSNYLQTKYYPIIVNITDYRWTLETASRGEWEE